MKTMTLILALTLSACAKPSANGVVTHEPFVPSPAPAAAPAIPTYATELCGETILTVGKFAFIVNLTTGATTQMIDGEIYQGTWGCLYSETAGVPKESL